MTTEFIHTDEINDEVLARAGAIIRRGGLVVFPTETVYGLGANALDAEAAKKVYAAKGRPSDNPLITHIATPEDADKYAVTNETYRRLARAFMPGPLTVILPKRDCIPLATTGGLDSVGIRCPENKIARQITQILWRKKKMGLFDFFKKKKEELPAKQQEEKIDASEREATSDAVEEDKWDRMWELWGEGQAASPYAEVLTYQSEINNGGHDQYFFNIENTGDLKKELAVLNSVLPELLKKNLNAAYKAYVALQKNEDDEKAEAILNQCDEVYYENEEALDDVLNEYAAKIELKE